MLCGVPDGWRGGGVVSFFYCVTGVNTVFYGKGR